jgi:hypothetical protein
MREQRGHSEPDEPLYGRVQRERPAAVRKLEQQVAPRLGDRQPPELLRWDHPEQAEVDLRSVDHLDGDTVRLEVRANLGDGLLHHLGRRREVVAHVGRGGEDSHALARQIERHGTRFAQGAGPVVHPRQDMRVEIDHVRSLVAFTPLAPGAS